MNSEIHSAFINAVLANATYVSGLQNGDQETKEVRDEFLSNAKRMP